MIVMVELCVFFRWGEANAKDTPEGERYVNLSDVLPQSSSNVLLSRVSVVCRRTKNNLCLPGNHSHISLICRWIFAFSISDKSQWISLIFWEHVHIGKC